MTGKPRILVVDDDDNIRTYLRTLLEKSRFEVKEVDCGADAIKCTKSWRPQIVLLDKELPDMDGFDVCKKLTSDGIRFMGKVVMLSGHKKTEDQVAGLCCGAVDYIIKPINPELLVAKINVALREFSDKDDRVQDTSTTISKGVFRLSTEPRELWVHNEKAAPLTETEYKIIKLLLESSPKCTQREELLAVIFQGRTEDLKLINVHLSNIRKKLGRSKARLETCRGQGLKLAI